MISTNCSCFDVIDDTISVNYIDIIIMTTVLRGLPKFFREKKKVNTLTHCDTCDLCRLYKLSYIRYQRRYNTTYYCKGRSRSVVVRDYKKDDGQTKKKRP